MLGEEGDREEEIRRGNQKATSKVTLMTGKVTASTGLGARLGVDLRASHSTFHMPRFSQLLKGDRTRVLVSHCTPSTWSSAQHTLGAK